MTWRAVAASAAGTSHLANGSSCQDSCIATIEHSPNGSAVLAIFVSDGAGSAPFGGVGAVLAIEAAADFVASECRRSPEINPNETWAIELIKAVRTKIRLHTEQHSTRARDLACTFLGVIAAESATLLVQIGDGGIVVDRGHGLEVPIRPMSGEYANTTHFVTDENALDHLETQEIQARCNRIAAFSDGIQRISLDMAKNIAFLPFFEPFFNTLARSTEEQEHHLQAELERFLQSPAVNERTDDDKTLAIAHWIE